MAHRVSLGILGDVVSQLSCRLRGQVVSEIGCDLITRFASPWVGALDVLRNGLKVIAQRYGRLIAYRAN